MDDPGATVDGTADAPVEFVDDVVGTTARVSLGGVQRRRLVVVVPHALGTRPSAQSATKLVRRTVSRTGR